MIIDFNRTVAYRCASCGEITFATFSLFELSGEKGISVECSCGKSVLNIMPENKTNYTVKVKCIICDDSHQFPLSFSALVKKDCSAFMCPNVVVGLAFIGHEEAVRKNVLANEEYISEVVTACGLDHTGKNGVTMLKALDKIQDLSDSENLYCECGSNLIDVEVYEDNLILQCCLCGNKIVITADDIRNGNFSHIDKLILKR